MSIFVKRFVAIFNLALDEKARYGSFSITTYGHNGFRGFDTQKQCRVHTGLRLFPQNIPVLQNSQKRSQGDIPGIVVLVAGLKDLLLGNRIESPAAARWGQSLPISDMRWICGFT